MKIKIFKYFSVLVVILGIALCVWLYNLYESIKHDVDTIVNYSPKQSTQFFDRNGKLIANTFNKENRDYVKYDDIPARVVEGLVAIEDTQYFEHFGINPDAISRAIIKDIKARAFVEGASTLTQQLVKMLVLTREKKIMRKVKEALLAIRLETVLSKEEILERYLNHVYFGHGYYGIKTAAKGYFDKDLYELNLKEIALLVGLPRAPSFYDPTKNLKISLARANQVITRLHTLGWINDTQYKQALTQTPKIHNQTLTRNKAPYIIDYATKILSKDFPDIKTGGYKVYLTIDLDAQDIAKKALKHSYNLALKRAGKNSSYTKGLNGAIVSIENNTGKILALVGGIDYSKSMYNRAVQAKRQPGSAIKPFLYQIGLNEGLNPASMLADISRTYNYSVNGKVKKWQPKNYGGNFKGELTLRQSLMYSRNLSTINLVTDTGINIVRKNLEEYGFKNLPNNLSITLGSMVVSPLELSQYYSMFSNSGTQVTPYIIDQVIDKNNKSTIYEPKYNKVNSPEQTFLITSILEDVINKGTAKRAKVSGIELAGKTGTTNDNIDAWFCGFSPSIQTVVWFGKDDNKPMAKSETGGHIAAPAFSYFFKNYLKIHPEISRNFVKPSNVYTSYINGKTEYYTEQSPLPDIEIKIPNENPNEEAMQF